MKIKFLKYYPFWLGLIVMLAIIDLTREFSSLGILLAFIIGYFKLTKLHENE